MSIKNPLESIESNSSIIKGANDKTINYYTISLWAVKHQYRTALWIYQASIFPFINKLVQFIILIHNKKYNQILLFASSQFRSFQKANQLFKLKKIRNPFFIFFKSFNLIPVEYQLYTFFHHSESSSLHLKTFSSRMMGSDGNQLKFWVG